MNKKRVVIAEDEPLIRLDLREALEDEGYEVVAEAGDGLEALQLVTEHGPDVAVLDIKMPGMDGIEAARQIVADRLCAVVLLTAFSQRDLIDQAREAGAMAYLVKPYKQSELVPAIELAFGRYRDLVALSQQSESLSDQLETRKILDRAKGVLIDQSGLSEQEAFRFLQTTAMSRRSTMKAVAELVLAGELKPES